MTAIRFHHISKTAGYRKRYKAFYFLIAILVLLICLSGCGQNKLDLHSEYQAVCLVNGQTFIGKLTGAGTDYPMLTEVFYIQSAVNPETKAVTNVLVKRGKEWHGPQFMYINAKNILVIEPVAPDSQVAKLVKEATAKSDGRAK